MPPGLEASLLRTPPPPPPLWLALQEISYGCQSLMRVETAFKHGVYPAARQGVRRGYVCPQVSCDTPCVLRSDLPSRKCLCFFVCYAMLCCAVLYCAMLCCAVLCFTCCALCSCMLFLLLEYCTGGTLHDRLQQHKKPTPTEVFDWILQVAARGCLCLEKKEVAVTGEWLITRCPV
jgi:hypothetical protein